MKEKRLIEIGEWLNTQGFDLDLSDSFWMENCRFGEHKVRDIAELLDDFCNQEVEKRIKEMMQMDNTYADGYVDGYFDSGKTPPPPITLDEADKLVQQTDYIIEATHQDINPINLGDAAAFFIEGYEYCRSRMTCSEKPNNSQKTEG